MNTLHRHCTNLRRTNVIGVNFFNCLSPGAFHVVSVRHIGGNGCVGDKDILIAGVPCKDLKLLVGKSLLKVCLVLLNHPVHPQHLVVVPAVRVHPRVDLQAAARLEDEELGLPLQWRRLPVVELAQDVLDRHLQSDANVKREHGVKEPSSRWCR